MRHYPLTCVGNTGEHGEALSNLNSTPELCGKLEYHPHFPTQPALIHPLKTGLMVWL